MESRLRFFHCIAIHPFTYQFPICAPIKQRKTINIQLMEKGQVRQYVNQRSRLPVQNLNSNHSPICSPHSTIVNYKKSPYTNKTHRIDSGHTKNSHLHVSVLAVFFFTRVICDNDSQFSPKAELSRNGPFGSEVFSTFCAPTVNL